MIETLEEKIQRYWNNQPCNVKHGDSEPSTLEFFQQVSNRRYRVEPHIPNFAGFQEWQNKKVLEIGPGIGSDAAEFARYGAEYYAIDYSIESVNLAKKRFEVENLQGQFRCGDASKAESYDGLPKMDLVYSFGVIHHFPALDKIIENVSNILTPGGEFRFMVYAKNSWKQAMINKGLDQYEAQTGCPYARSFTKEEISEILGDKFQVDTITQDHCFMYNVASYKVGKYELEPWFEAMDASMREAVKEQLGWHLLVTARKI
jgi:SAM-dependent methyltransferase